MSEPAFDLFGQPVAEEPAAPAPEPEPAEYRKKAIPPAAKPKRAKPAPRPVVILPPEPPRAPLPPIPFGRSPDAPKLPQVRDMPWFEVRVRRDRLQLPCLFCREPTEWTVHVVRPWDAHDLTLCQRCRGSAPSEAQGPLAGPWVLIWLREAGLIPWMPRKGSLG